MLRPRLSPDVDLRILGPQVYLLNRIWGYFISLPRREAFILNAIEAGLSADVTAEFVSRALEEVSEDTAVSAVGACLEKHHKQLEWRDSDFERSPRNLSFDDILESTYSSNEILPAAINISIANNCNFRCSYCYFGKSFSPSKTAPLPSVLKTLDEARDMGVMTVFLSGGEPTIYPGIADVVDRILQNGMVPSISTNGFMLTTELIDSFRASGLRGLQFSVDSFRLQTQEKITATKGTLPNVLQAMSRCIESGIAVRTKTVVTNDNLPEVEELLDKLVELGVKVISFTPELTGTATESSSNHNVRLRPMQAAELYQTLIRAENNYPEILLKVDSVEDRWNDENEIISCGNVTHSIVIHWDGAATPCEMISDAEMQMGNVFKDGLRQVWFGEQRNAVVASTIDPDTVDPDCAVCSKLSVCRTGCYNLSKYKNGGYLSKDPRCGGPYLAPHGEQQQAGPSVVAAGPRR
jgi:radical SAM protein with 4Fe4S-binding SPASM domain